MVKITRGKISLDSLVQKVRKNSSGAVVFFVGVVRDHNEGKEVKEIDYECYEELALREMGKIREELIKKFSLDECAIIHRIGKMKVGEASLIVVVSSPHRKESQNAIIDAVNLIKKRVPVWKKEFYADGTYSYAKGEKMEVKND